MPTAMLAYSGKGRGGELPLDPCGLVIGRNPDCGLVLDSSRVSRKHARIFQDPFKRWLIEDLGSRHGVVIGGERVHVHALLPGEQVSVGPFTLRLSGEPEKAIDPHQTAASTSTGLLSGDADVELVPMARPQGAALSRARLKELNALTDELAGHTRPAELYATACRQLARVPESAAAVVRLPAGEGPLPMAPQVVACCLPGGDSAAAANVYLSRRVLEALRTSEEPVLARSVHAAGKELALTILDEQRPRVVVCAPLGRQQKTLDALYLDLPQKRATEDILDFVEAVARSVVLSRKVLLLAEMRAQRRVLDRELALAQEIQARLTPRNAPRVEGLDVAFCYEPVMWVGGDYCDLWLLPDGRLAFAVGDVSGKGLPAAMIMANLQAALRIATVFCTSPSEAMDHVNRHLCQHLPDGMFVTLFLGFLSAADGRLEYVNAGHLPPLLLGPDRGAALLGLPSNPILGILDHSFVAQAEHLPPSTALLAVTDGITEAMDPRGEQFTLHRLQEQLRGGRARSAARLVREVTKAADGFRDGRPPQDDVTVLALVRGPRPR